MEKEITSTGYQLPPLELLDEYAAEGNVVPDEEIAGKTESIRKALEKGKVQVKDIKAVPGPAVTLYKVYPERKVTISKVRSLMKYAAPGLNLRGVRVVTLDGFIGIEIANDHRTLVPVRSRHPHSLLYYTRGDGNRALVPIRSVLSDNAFRNCKAELPVAIGRTFGNKTVVFDLAKAPNLLIAGVTKRGKTEAIHTIVASLLYSKRPSELKFVFIDPKGFEFSAYSRIKGSYLAMTSDGEPIVNANVEVEKVLASLCHEMERRRELFRGTRTRNIRTYNRNASEALPYIVTIVDEYADLVIPARRDKESRNMSHNITESIIRLAQNGRTVGIHVILATQWWPAKRVITDTLKATFPTRIAVSTVSKTDSQTILDTPGAESLVCSGDMIFQTEGEEIRLQGAYISPDETDRLVSYVESCPDSGSPYCLPTLSPSEP